MDAICALELEPSALCSPGWGGESCDGEQLLRCMYGYPVERTDCATNGQSCVSTPEYSLCKSLDER